MPSNNSVPQSYNKSYIHWLQLG